MSVSAVLNGDGGTRYISQEARERILSLQRTWRPLQRAGALFLPEVVLFWEF